MGEEAPVPRGPFPSDQPIFGFLCKVSAGCLSRVHGRGHVLQDSHQVLAVNLQRTLQRTLHRSVGLQLVVAKNLGGVNRQFVGQLLFFCVQAGAVVHVRRDTGRKHAGGCVPCTPQSAPGAQGESRRHCMDVTPFDLWRGQTRGQGRVRSGQIHCSAQAQRPLTEPRAG